MQAGQYARALHCFLQAPPTPANEAIDSAIECVGLAKNDALTHQLVDYLMGERDGIPKARLETNLIFIFDALNRLLRIGRQVCLPTV